MSYSAGVSKGFGAEDQKPIRCDSGLNLFVILPIDSTESTQVDGLSSRACCLHAPPVQTIRHPRVVEEVPFRLHNWWGKQRRVSLEGSESRSRGHEELSCSKVGLGELGEDLMHFGEVTRQEYRYPVRNEMSDERIRQRKQSGQFREWPPAPDFVARKPFARFDRGQIRGERQYLNCSGKGMVQKWKDHPDDRSSLHDHDNLIDPGSLEKTLGKHSEYECSSRDNLVGVYRDLFVKGNTDYEGPEDRYKERSSFRYKERSSLQEESYSCHENRSWSPQAEDYTWRVPLDVNSDHDNHVTGSNDDSTCVGERLDQDCATLPASSLLSEYEVLGRMPLEHAASPNLETSLATSPEIESFDTADLLAARTIVEMSAEYSKELIERELSAKSKSDVHNLPAVFRGNIVFRGTSEEGSSRLAKMVNKVHATLCDADVHTTCPDVPSGSGEMTLSQWSDDDRCISRGVRDLPSGSGEMQLSQWSDDDRCIPRGVRDLPSGSGEMKLSQWSDDDRCIPRGVRDVPSGSGDMELQWSDDRSIPRRVRAKDPRRGSKLSTRKDFGISEYEEESDCEVLQSSPRRRRYRSTQELMQA